GQGEPAAGPDKDQTPAFPFFAEITGDNVLFRSGPGTNFYTCGKLNKGDRVKVVSKQYSWYRIVPPPNSFCWISAQYVTVDPENPGFGIVTGDRVRVYAGSNGVKPHHSTSLLGKTNKGDRVKLLGEEQDDYHKIAPPAFAYLWVSTYFAKPLPAGTVVEPADVPPTVKVKPPVEISPGEVPPVVKFDPSDEPVVTPPAPAPVPESIVPAGSRLEQYQALRKLIDAERAKPADQQDYKAIKKALDEIVNDKEAGKVARYAEFVLKQVVGYELALSMNQKIRLQKEQLAKKTARISETRTTRLASVEDLGRFAATGTLKPFTLYGAGHYRIVDDSGMMLCYALPSGAAARQDLTGLIGREVGIVGTIQPHLPTKKALVRFSEIVPLD
ncbi:MAG: SH3 domain-containing protein, partial [Planctomycetota bacterium]